MSEASIYVSQYIIDLSRNEYAHYAKGTSANTRHQEVPVGYFQVTATYLSSRGLRDTALIFLEGGDQTL